MAIIDHDPTLDLGNKVGAREQEWFKQPNLTLIRDGSIPIPFGLTDSAVYYSEAERLQTEIDPINTQVQNEVEQAFQTEGCNTQTWINQPIPESIQSHNVVLNPIYMGQLPDRASHAIANSDSLTDEDFTNMLRESLPEIRPPQAIAMGKAMGVDNPLRQPNFTNVIYIRDDEDNIAKMPQRKLRELLRMTMAKEGAFRSVIIPYGVKEDQTPEINHYILGTLEGGQAVLDSAHELAFRLMALGSTTDVKIAEKRAEDALITNEQWMNSATVNGLIALGKFLGQRNLLSEPVEISKLVSAGSEKLAQFISLAIRWSRQAEGAFYAHDPTINPGAANSTSKWSGLPIVTATGRFGAVKTNLQPDELVGIVPTGNTSIETIGVEGLEIKPPSVEAEEFLLPQVEAEFEKYYLRLKKVESGYVEDPEGDIIVSPIRGVVHLHRGVQANGERVFEISNADNTDIRKYPPVGCGVDLMHRMSKDAMHRAAEESSARADDPVAASFYVPNHGTNIFVFWAKGEDGVIPEDPFELLKKSIESESLVFSADVPQV